MHMLMRTRYWIVATAARGQSDRNEVAMQQRHHQQARWVEYLALGHNDRGGDQTAPHAAAVVPQSTCVSIQTLLTKPTNCFPQFFLMGWRYNHWAQLNFEPCDNFIIVVYRRQPERYETRGHVAEVSSATAYDQMFKWAIRKAFISTPFPL